MLAPGVRTQLLVVRLEDMQDDPREGLARVFRHVGLGTDMLNETIWAAMVEMWAKPKARARRAESAEPSSLLPRRVIRNAARALPRLFFFACGTAA